MYGISVTRRHNLWAVEHGLVLDDIGDDLVDSSLGMFLKLSV